MSFKCVFRPAESESGIHFLIWAFCTKICQLLPRKCQLSKVETKHYSWIVRHVFGGFWGHRIRIMWCVVKLVIILINMSYLTKWMSNSNSKTPKTIKRQVLRSQKPIHKTCFTSTWKSWHFRGKSWHILVQMPQIKKQMSDSCSATLKTPRNVFLRKKILEKKIFFGTPIRKDCRVLEE